MNFKKTSSFVVSSIAATLAIVSIVMISGVSEAPMIVADKDKAKGLYKMADATQVVATFEFRAGVETVNIPIFDQKTDISTTSRPTFTFQKIVSDTPLLHQAADTFQKFMGRDASYPHNYNDFEAIIDIYHDGKQVRSFEYNDCKITSYMIATLSDKEEAYLGKGFAVVEDYEVECSGYKPYASDFEGMMDDLKTPSSDSLSTMDLLEQQSVWDGNNANDLRSNDVETKPSKMNSLQRIGDTSVYSEYRN